MKYKPVLIVTPLTIYVRGMFLDISKAFDKVWHKRLLYKLKSYEVEDELLSLLECYVKTKGCFKCSKFRLDINKFWCTTGASTRSPFILDTRSPFILDLPDNMSICKIFADDTSFYSKIIDTRNSQNTLTSDLKSIKNWTYNGKCNLILIQRSKEMRFSFLGNQIHVHAIQ